MKSQLAENELIFCPIHVSQNVQYSSGQVSQSDGDGNSIKENAKEKSVRINSIPASQTSVPMVSDMPSVAPGASTLEKEKSVLESAEENPMKKQTVENSLLHDSANIEDGLDDSANTAENPITPLAGPNVMNIIVVAAECAPWSKTGKISSRFL